MVHKPCVIDARRALHPAEWQRLVSKPNGSVTHAHTYTQREWVFSVGLSRGVRVLSAEFTDDSDEGTVLILKALVLRFEGLQKLQLLLHLGHLPLHGASFAFLQLGQ